MDSGVTQGTVKSYICILLFYVLCLILQNPVLYKVLQNGQDGSQEHAASYKASYEFLNFLSTHYIIFPLIAGVCFMLINHDLVLKGPSVHYILWSSPYSIESISSLR